MTAINLPNDPKITEKRKLNVTLSGAQFTTSIDLVDDDGNVLFSGAPAGDGLGAMQNYGQQKSDAVIAAEAEFTTAI